MAGQKKLEATAKKALKKAKEAVAEAEAKADKASKKSRSKAADLRTDLKKTTARVKLERAQLDDAKKAVKTKKATVSTTADAKTKTAKKLAPTGTSAVYTPPLPHEVTVEVPGKGGSTSSADLSSLTMIQLRSLARDKKVVGYSRLSKATLVEKLQA